MEYKKILKHPVTKRMVIAIPLGVTFALFRSWFGFEESAFLGLLFGVLAYFIAYGILMGEKEREFKLDQFVRYLKGNISVVIQMCLWTTIIIASFGSQKTPNDPLIKQIQLFVELFGLFAIIMYPIYRSFYRTFVSGDFSSMNFYITKIVSGVAIYSFALWVLGEFGDDAKIWILANPNEAVVVTVTFFIIWSILHFSVGISDCSQNIARSRDTSASMTAVGLLSPPPTKRDNKYTAAHESGHVIVYAALGCLPPGIKLVIKESLDGSLGFISSINSDHQLNEKIFSEWFMLVLLAGKKGESFMYGENTLGSTNDHSRWTNIARNYLSNHFNGIYYQEPDNKFEQEENEKKLEALQSKQLAELKELFEVNSKVFYELADTLLDKKLMGRDDLVPFLSKIVLPKSFPLPLGSFDTFRNQWPHDIGMYTDNDKNIDPEKK